MTLAALFLALAAAPAAPAAEQDPPPRGVELATATATVSATVLRGAIVRQASGVEHRPDAPRPQMTRRGREVLAEYQ